jgi:hypothetical protein
MNSKHSISVVLLAMGLFMIACGQETKDATHEEIIALEKEVIRVHDEVMPKMSDIARLSEILEQEALNTNLDSVSSAAVRDALAQLTSADSLMWEWMHNYNKPEDAPAETIKAYLLKEQQRVQVMRDAMLRSISNAESLAQKLGHVAPN